MLVKRVPISAVNPAPYNPRKDLKPGDPEYEKLKRSIDHWDLVEPLVWNERTANLVGGHQRLKILRARGDTEVDVSVVNLGETDEKALNIALNKIQGDWDFAPLADLLTELDTGAFDLTLTGFGSQELEDIMSYCHLPEVVDYSEHEDDRGNRTAPGKGKMVVSVGTMSALVDYEVVQAMMSRIEARWGNGDEGVNAFCQWFISE